MSEWLNPDLEDASKLRRRFLQARPFRHLVLDQFLTPAPYAALAAAFPAFDPARAINELGEVGGKAVVADIGSLGEAYVRFDTLIRSPQFLSWLAEVTGIPDLLYDPDYVGGGTHDNRDGQDLDPHVDFNYHPTRGWHRRLNLILFLNDEWSPEWGGCLELQHDPWNAPADGAAVVVAPLANRCVIFETTESSWHGFRRIALPPERSGLSRRSIAVYFYTRQRPRRETAPSHSTVYVPRPLPGHLQPGYTLREEDLHELQVLLYRRDAQIRFLYERELEFSRIWKSPSYRLVSALARPLRSLLERIRRWG